MRYMLVNSSPGNLQVDLYDPETSYNNRNLHRPGPVVALSLRKGQAQDILKYFEGSVEKAHKAVLHSRDSLKMFRPGMLYTYVCDDLGRPINVDVLLADNKMEYTDHPKEDPEVTNPDTSSSATIAAQDHPEEDSEATNPDMSLSATIAAQDQFEAKKNGEANLPISEEKGVVGKVVDFFTGKTKDEPTTEGTEDSDKDETAAEIEEIVQHTKKLLESHTKAELVKIAKDDFKLELKFRTKHGDLVKAILKAQKAT